MPSTRPRSPAGYAELRIAELVANIMAAPTPWRIRNAINMPPDVARPLSSDMTVKALMPSVKTRLRPWISAARPKGTRQIATANEKAVATQPRATASMPSSLPMTGRETFSAEPMKAVEKEAMLVVKRTDPFAGMFIYS